MRPHRRARRPAGALAGLVLTVVLAACGGSGSPHPSAAAATAGSTTTATRASAASAPASIVAVLHTPGHDPRPGNWPITLTVTKDGRPVAGSISYAFLFQGQVVSTQPVSKESPDFVGHFHDIILWPARSAGVPLTFRVIIHTAYGTKDVDYAVNVQR